MAIRRKYGYKPDYAVPPGVTLAETLETLQMSQAELARRTGLHPKTINEIINKGEPISPETAQKLETVLGVPASLWNNLEKNYRQRLAELREREELRGHDHWLKEIGVPARAMINLGWVSRHKDKADTNKEILGNLGVASAEAFWRVYSDLQVSFRKSTAFECSPGSLVLWLRKGEIDAQSIECEPYDRERLLAALPAIRKLSRLSPDRFMPQIRSLFAPAGVAVVYVPGLPGCPVSGTSQWLTKDKALIQLSGRHRKDDHFWFTLFHEAGHIVLHSRDSKKAVFLDDKSQKTECRREKQANRFASDWLIPREAFREMRTRWLVEAPGEASVKRYAQRLGISPGIIVGRLQHERLIPFNSALNALKRDVCIR